MKQIKLIAETELTDCIEQCILPFWKNHVRQGAFSGQHGVRVSYAWAIPDDCQGTVVISSGRIESLLKYKEVMYDLYQHGLAVFILDHRGQGLSGRMTDNPHHGYVSSFDDYVDDLVYFYQHIVQPNKQGQTALLCHSMGSAIGALTILRHPAMFSCVAFCSPMFGIRPALPDSVASILLWMSDKRAVRRGQKNDFFFGQRDYKPVPFALNKLTHSRIRYDWFRKLYNESPEIQLGGVTGQWLAAAREAMKTIRQRANELKLPVLLLSAGADKVVDNSIQEEVAAKMPHCAFTQIPGAEHELFIESDAYRQPAMESVLRFFFAQL